MDENLQCNNLSGIDLTDIKLPSNITPAAATTFANKLTAAAEIYGEDGAVLYQPDNTELITKAKEAENTYLGLLGEDRFNGLDLKKFMYARYFVADETSNAVDVIDFQTPTELNLCDEEGKPYTVTVPMLNKYFDSNKKQVQFPLFDSVGYQVTLPLFDSQGKFILTEVLTATDATGHLVKFPLRNIYKEYVRYPVRDLNGSIITKPTKPSTILRDISAAQAEISNLYDLSKDKHAYQFVDYIINQQKQYDIGMFDGNISMNMASNTKVPNVSYFVVGFFNKGATTTDLESDDLAYYARYYPDRAELVKTTFTSLSGTATFTTYDVEYS